MSVSCFIYHNRKATIDDLLKYDIVLTTYGTVAAELKRLEKFYEDNTGRNIDYNDGRLAITCPLLHPRKANFYRIVLDEAQCIKNPRTRTAVACHKLKATYRWCLTGTPMMNGVSELFSIVHFLHIKPYNTWEKFRMVSFRQISSLHLPCADRLQSFGVLFGKRGNPRHLAMNRLRALLKAIMLRRKKDSELDGKPILRLPAKIEEDVHVTLSDDELDFYKQLEERSRVLFNKYLREGSVSKNYTAILVLLLRLRQACCHPHLNLDLEDVSPRPDDAMLALVRALEKPIVERIKASDGFECPICMDAVQTPSFFVPCGHESCGQCLTHLADNASAQNLQQGTESDQVRCPVCSGPFDPRKTFTYDAFKAVHMADTNPLKDDDDDDEDDEGDDKMAYVASEDDDNAEDADQHGNLKGFVVQEESDFEKEEEEDEDKNTRGERTEESKVEEELGKVVDTHETTTDLKKRKKGKKKAQKIKPSMLKQLRQESLKSNKAYKKYMRYLKDNWKPAAKVTECMRLLTEIRAAGEKTIVFSQWTLLLDLVQVAMHHEGLQKPERYDGSMTCMQRVNAAQAFRTDKNVKVMLVSLRAGNAGLNLISASRVIILDPFWNPYIEMQAIDRAHRIGQKREVKVYRILTQETVEDRIEALKERKRLMVEAALDEAESSRIGRLGAAELKYLFTGSY